METTDGTQSRGVDSEKTQLTEAEETRRPTRPVEGQVNSGSNSGMLRSPGKVILK
jgi:hypothetical protein